MKPSDSIHNSETMVAELETKWAQAWLNFAGPGSALSLRAAPVAADAGLGGYSETVRELSSQLSPGLSDDQREVFKNLQQNGHPTRLVEWLLARQAEKNVLQRVKEEGYRSLSHTQSSHRILALALGAERTSPLKFSGVGVDLEFSSRAISEGVVKKLVHDSERTWLSSGDLQALDFWILKEAAFKAIPQNQGAVISSFQVSKWNSQKNEGEVTSPLLKGQGLTCRVMKVEAAGLKAAFAYSFKTMT